LIAQLTPATRALLERPFKMLIDGEWVEAREAGSIDVFNPADGAVIATIPAGEAIDVDAAVGAARQAFEERRWHGLAPGRRASILWRLADLLDTHAEAFAQLETLDNGKPITMARAMDVPAAASVFRYWAGWCTKIGGQTPLVDLPGEFMAMTLKEAVGVVGLITPWNFPLVNVSIKLAPALAAGCTIVLKPAEQTSLTALRLGELMLEAGLPPGVVNIVTGYGRTAGAAIAGHMDVDKVSFTGSTGVGKDLISASRGNLKRLTLELGGKSPTIILPDADLAKAIPAAAGAIFRNAGQACAAGSRLLVSHDRFDEVVEGVAALARAQKLGPGLDPTTTMGPLVSALQQERVLGYVESARRDQADIIVGGRAHGDEGYFVEPTVIIDPRAAARVTHEEIFGPVLVATPFGDLDQLADLANDTVYGLSAAIWSRDVTSAYRLAKRLRAGTITVNSGMVTGPNLPFGGFKQSGWGREGGQEGLDAYLETKTIVTAL